MATEDMTHGGAHCGAKMRRASRRLLLPEELVEIERTVDKLAMNYLRKKTDSHVRPFDNPLRDVIVADSDHGYGPLYFLLAFSYGAEFLAVNGALCYTSLHQRVGPSWRLVLPLACTLVYGGYVIGYAWGLPNVFRSELILTTVICTLVWLEIVTKGRFLPANEGYV